MLSAACVPTVQVFPDAAEHRNHHVLHCIGRAGQIVSPSLLLTPFGPNPTEADAVELIDAILRERTSQKQKKLLSYCPTY